MSQFRIALVTTSGTEETERLANLLVGAGLAPCVNISYDVPEIISLEISQLSPSYAAYLGDFLK